MIRPRIWRLAFTYCFFNRELQKYGKNLKILKKKGRIVSDHMFISQAWGSRAVNCFLI
jgi:hypothetical protein